MALELKEDTASAGRAPQLPFIGIFFTQVLNLTCKPGSCFI
jgi:hypothetical protein